MTEYGKRGGDGPTRGKVASVYEVTLPDGTTIRKRSFDVHDDHVIGWGTPPDDRYPQWIITVGNRPPCPDWITMVELPAKRIKEGHT